MKFTGSILGKIFLIIICLVLGVAIALGGLVGGLYYIFTTSKMGTVTEYVGDYLPAEVDFSNEVKEMTVLQWTTELLNKLSAMDDVTVEEFEGLLGYGFITNTLEQIVGVAPENIKNSTFANLGSDIADSITLDTASTKFNIVLPDMPLFQDAEFLGKPLSEAFTELEKEPLEKFVKINDGSNTSLPTSHSVMIALRDMPVKDLGTPAFDERLDTMKLCDVIDLSKQENKVIAELKDKTLGELKGSEVDNTINSMFLCELLDIDESSSDVLKALRYSAMRTKTTFVNISEFNQSTIKYKGSEKYDPSAEYSLYADEFIYTKEGVAYLPVKLNGNYVYSDNATKYEVYETKVLDGVIYPIIGVDESAKKLTVKDVIEVDGSNKLLNSVKDSLISELGNDINLLFMDEMMEIRADSPMIMKAIRYSALKSKTLDVSKTARFDHSPSASLRSKEVAGFEYLYLINSNGSTTVYVKKSDTAAYYKVYETKEYNGKNYPIIGIDETVDNLKIKDVFEPEKLETGALSLIEADTKLTDISSKIGDKVSSSTLSTLLGTQVIAEDYTEQSENMPKEQKAYIYNSSLCGMLSGVMRFVSNPILKDESENYIGINYGPISPRTIEMSDGTVFNSLYDFVNAYTFGFTDDFTTIKISGNVVVNINMDRDRIFLDKESKYILPLFNLDKTTSDECHITFNIMINETDNDVTSDGTVKLGVVEMKSAGGVVTAEISKHQFAFAFDATNSNLVYTGGAGYTRVKDGVILYEYFG